MKDTGFRDRTVTLAGTFFFLAAGIALLVNAWPHEWISLPINAVAATLTVNVVAAAGFGIGWVKGFPRWSYPYAAYSIVFAIYWTGVATPAVTILNHTFERNELWGWRAWIPLVSAVAVALMVTHSARPITGAVRDIRRDWTRLSFAVYGLLPLAVALCFDEVHNLYEFPFTLAATVAMVCGAFAYLRSRRMMSRALSLLAGAGVTMAVAAAGNGVYWHGRQEAWMRAPADGYQAALGVGIMSGVAMAMMFLPALLRFFPAETRCNNEMV